MIKKLLIIVIADILILGYFVFYMEKPNPSVAIGEIVIISVLFIINLVAGLILMASRRKEAAKALLINAILAPIILHITWGAWYNYYDELNYTTAHFHLHQKNIYSPLASKPILMILTKKWPATVQEALLAGIIQKPKILFTFPRTADAQ